MCGRGHAGPWSAWRTQKRGPGARLGPGNTNVLLEGAGRVLYRVLPPSHHPVYPSPVPTWPAPHLSVRAMHRTGASAMTAVLWSTKEILGVEYAHHGSGHASGLCLALPATLRPAALRPLCACSSPFYHILSISQYFSVFLRYGPQLYLSYISVISQIWTSVIPQLYLSISQYIINEAVVPL